VDAYLVLRNADAYLMRPIGIVDICIVLKSPTGIMCPNGVDYCGCILHT